MSRRIDRDLVEASLPPLDRSAWVEIDVDVLTANAAALGSAVAPASLGVVVKADGYGHGLEMAARCASAAGATWLCVATASEATRLRADGYDGRVFVLYPVPPAAVAPLARMNVDVTIGSLEQARALADHFPTGVDAVSIHLEIDTGMTRGGVSLDDAIEAAGLLESSAANLAGVWTHLSTPEAPLDIEHQLARFDVVLRNLAADGNSPGVVHASASGGLLASVAGRYDMVRPGLAFYGLHPGAGDPLPEDVGPALSLRAHAVRLAEVAAGTAVGYAGTWTANRPSRIATLPVGYADGYSRSSSPGASVLVEGTRAPVVGRVSSDSITVDVTDVAGVSTDSEFTLLGKAGIDEISADELAGIRGTISWEVLQQLSSRLARVYVANSAPIATRRESSVDFEAAPDTTIPQYR